MRKSKSCYITIRIRNFPPHPSPQYVCRLPHQVSECKILFARRTGERVILWRPEHRTCKGDIHLCSFPVFLKYFLSRIKLTHAFLISRVSGLQENTRTMPLVGGTFHVALVVKNPPANAGDVRDAGSIPGWEDPLEKEMTAHSSIFAWEIPWTKEPDGLKSIGSQLDMTEVTQHASKHAFGEMTFCYMQLYFYLSVTKLETARGYGLWLALYFTPSIYQSSGNIRFFIKHTGKE